MYESILNNPDPNYKSTDYKEIKYKGITLDLIKDHYIYEVFYKENYLGYFYYSRLNDAITNIEQIGFYNGYNYDYKLRKLKIL